MIGKGGKMSSNILVECVAPLPSVRVGVLEPLKLHQESGRCSLRFVETKNIKNADIAWADTVISVRGSEYISLCVLRAAKQAGRKVIYFLDDDLLDIPQGNESSPYFSCGSIKETIEEALRCADILWCVNQSVADKYASYVRERAVVLGVPARIEKEVCMMPKEKVKLLYAGSIDHRAVLQEYILPAVERLADEMGEKVEFTFIGPDPGLSGKANVYHREFFYNYDEYKNFVRDGGFDIGIAPIRVSDFYAAKYFNKFIEYSSIGATGIYTDALPYRLVVEDGKNGFLCRNTPEDWYEKMRSLILDQSALRSCAQAAQEKLRREFSHEKISRDLEEKLPELLSYKAEEIQSSLSRLPNLQRLFYQEKLRLYLKIYGIRTLPIIGRKIIKTLKKRR